MPRVAAPICLEPQDRLELERWVAAHGTPQQVIPVLESLAEVETVTERTGSTGMYTVQWTPGSATARAIFEKCAANHWVITELRPIETRLEDVFRGLTLA